MGWRGLAERDQMRHTTIREHDQVPTANIQMGEVSQRVCDVQAFLGLPAGPWEYSCVALLIEYQQFSGLVADGICGPKTLEAIEATKARDAALSAQHYVEKEE